MTGQRDTGAASGAAARPDPFRLALALVAGLAGLPATAAEPAPDGAARPPSVILVLADDLGYGDLGSYGQRLIQTPHLDAMAREGMRFSRFYTGAPLCAPARCSLLTGKHAGHCTVRTNGEIPLRADEPTLGQLFQRHGHRTAAVGKWGLGLEDSGSTPRARGFDEFYGVLGHRHAHNHYPHYVWHDETREALPNEVPDPGADGSGVASRGTAWANDLYTEQALGFIDANAGRPFFLYLAYTVPHANNGRTDPHGLEVPDLGPYRDRDWKDVDKSYAAMVTRMDEGMGRILERLRRHGIASDTLVLFTSDNGPHAEGGYDPRFLGSAGPFRGIKRDLHEGGIRVPLIAWWPGRIAPGGVADAHDAYFPDVLATAAELLGEGPVPGTDGIGLLPTLLGRPGEQRAHDALYWEAYGRSSPLPERAVLMDGWKAMRSGLPWAPVRLYDLGADPGERTNLAARHPDVAARAGAAMAAEGDVSLRNVLNGPFWHENRLWLATAALGLCAALLAALWRPVSRALRPAAGGTGHG